MPYSSEWVEPEVFMEHNGTKVYHIYKDDDIDQGPRFYWFTLDPVNGSDTDQEHVFDVRDLTKETDIEKPGTDWREQIIRAALDAGTLKPESEEGE